MLKVVNIPPTSLLNIDQAHSAEKHPEDQMS